MKVKSKEVNNSVLKVFIVVVTLLVCFDSYLIMQIEEKEEKEESGIFIKADDIDKNVNKTKEIIENIEESKKVYGTYNVKSDKNSLLQLKEEGNYVLTVNKCDGYLTLEGTYEIRDKKLILNNTAISDIENLSNNSEISFTIVDSNTIRLEEDIACLYQGILFERNN